MHTQENPAILLIATMPHGAAIAAAMMEQLDVPVELAATRSHALASLRRSSFSVIVIEQSLSEQDPEWAERIWLHSGAAVPLELNFAISARTRLFREVKSALLRRTREMDLARRDATVSLGNEIKGSVTGLLLQTQLTLHEPGIPAALAPKLHHLVTLATEIRERLRQGL